MKKFRAQSQHDKHPALVPIEAAITAGGWPAALQLAATASGSLADRMLCDAEVGNWAEILAKEPLLLRKRALERPEDLPQHIAVLLARARLKLWMLPEALDLARAILSRSPGDRDARHLLVSVLLDLNQNEEALAVALELWHEGYLPILRDATACMIRMEAFGQCQVFLEAAKGKLPDRKRMICQRDLATAMGNDDAALELIWQLKPYVSEARHAAMLAVYARRSRREDLTDGLLATVVALSQNPGARGDFLEYGPRILQAFWECRPDSARTLELLQKISQYVLPPRSAHVAASVYAKLGRVDIAIEILRRSVSAFPSAVLLWSKLLNLCSQTRDAAAGAALVDQMRAALPLSAAYAALLDALSSTWPIEIIPDLAEFAERSSDPAMQAKFFAGMSTMQSVPDDLLEALETRVARDTPLNGLRLSLVLRRTHDRRLLQQAVAAPVDFAAFGANRDESLHSFDKWAQATVVPGAAGVDPAFQIWLANCWQLLDKLTANARKSLLHTAECFADAAALTDFLVDRIIRGVPTSALRLGDCEGSFLPSEGEWPDEVLLRQVQCKMIWWGDRQPESVAEKKMIYDFLGATDRADVLGVMPHFRLIADKKDNAAPIRVAQQYGLARLVARGTSSVVTSAHFHQDLDSWSLWDEIFAATPSVSWISCHDLTTYLREVRGVDTREGVAIPAEQKYSGLFRSATPGDCPPCATGDRLLIDVHDAICASLDPKPGEVWLVAAGFLGKIYCDLIRQRGGIGLDVGSIVDYWMGFSTRIYHGAEDNALVPSLLPIVGRNRPLPAPEIVRNRMIGLPGTARSARSGSWNIANASEAAPPPPVHNQTLRLIGHPRCASGYMATVFSAHNQLVGHEKLARDGISSWMYVVRDHRLPFGDNVTLTHQFRHTVLFLRDPAQAIASIVLENGISQSFDFRRGHILRATGCDIASLTQPLIRSIASYVLWNQMAIALKPDVIIAVERAEEEVPAWLAHVGLAQPGLDNARGIDGFNSTDRKRGFVLQKTSVSRQDWLELARTLPENLHNGLVSLCTLGGYALPWAHPVSE